MSSDKMTLLLIACFALLVVLIVGFLPIPYVLFAGVGAIAWLKALIGRLKRKIPPPILKFVEDRCAQESLLRANVETLESPPIHITQLKALLAYMNWRESNITVVRSNENIVCDCIAYYKKRICVHSVAVSKLTTIASTAHDGDTIDARPKRGPKKKTHHWAAKD